MTATVLALGLVCWLVTKIVVESVLFRPLRFWLDGKAFPTRTHRYYDRPVKAWEKARYLVNCHLCAGTWIGLALAAVTPYRPLGPGFLGVVLAGLLYKAAGHAAMTAEAYALKETR